MSGVYTVELLRFNRFATTKSKTSSPLRTSQQQPKDHQRNCKQVVKKIVPKKFEVPLRGVFGPPVAPDAWHYQCHVRAPLPGGGYLLPRGGGCTLLSASALLSLGLAHLASRHRYPRALVLESKCFCWRTRTTVYSARNRPLRLMPTIVARVVRCYPPVVCRWTSLAVACDLRDSTCAEGGVEEGQNVRWWQLSGCVQSPMRLVPDEGEPGRSLSNWRG